MAKNTKILKSKNAFNLVEMSFLITIVSILIIATTQGSRLIYEMRLETARNITRNSPINSIKDMVLWLEPTLADSFDSKVENNNKIAFWKDNSTHLTTQIRAQQTNPTLQPTYIREGINRLPTIKFENSMLQIDNFTIGADHTIFVVFQVLSESISTGATFLTLSNNNSYGLIFEVAGSSGAIGKNRTLRSLYRFPFGNNTGDGDQNYSNSNFLINSLTSYFAGYTRNFSGAKIFNFYLNGNLVNENSLNVVTNPEFASATSLIIGCSLPTICNNPFKGYISEIIIFNRSLISNEINDIHNYLSKKYAIKI